MATIILILILGALIGAVIWNHKNRDAATDGVEFTVPGSVGSVASAIGALYCDGARAKAKSFVSGLTVTPAGPTSFRFESRIGDVGEISVDGSGGAVTVRARTSELYIGSHPVTHFRKGLTGTGAALTHGVYKLLGITPNAAKMKHFQNGLEGRVCRHLDRASA